MHNRWRLPGGAMDAPQPAVSIPGPLRSLIQVDPSVRRTVQGWGTVLGPAKTRGRLPQQRPRFLLMSAGVSRVGRRGDGRSCDVGSASSDLLSHTYPLVSMRLLLNSFLRSVRSIPRKSSRFSRATRRASHSFSCTVRSPTGLKAMNTDQHTASHCFRDRGGGFLIC